jgi:hypothetical protein
MDRSAQREYGPASTARLVHPVRPSLLPKTGQKGADSPFYHKDFLERQAQEELGEESQEDTDEE